MKNKITNIIAINIIFFLILGVAFIFLGLEIEALSDSALEEWYPKREFMCFEHNGEFDELFSLRDISHLILNCGFFIILIGGIAIIFLETHIRDVKEKAKECHIIGNTEK